MKMVKIVLLLLVFIFQSKTVLLAQTIEDVLKYSMVKIVIQFSDKKFVSIGSGFFFENDSTIVSAGHVYLKCQEAMLRKRDGNIAIKRFSQKGEQQFTASIIAKKINYAYELAIFSIKNKSKSFEKSKIIPIKPAQKNVKIGDELLLIGYYGSDKFPIVLKTICSGFSSVKGKPTITELLFDKITNQGQSGGVLLSAETLKLTGIALSTVRIEEESDLIQTGISKAAAVESLKILSK